MLYNRNFIIYKFYIIFMVNKKILYIVIKFVEDIKVSDKVWCNINLFVLGKYIFRLLLVFVFDCE